MATKRPYRSSGAPLTPKQQRFVEKLPTASSATAAAIEAGYSLSSAAESASQSLRLSNVKAALAEQQAQIAAPSIATQIERKELLTASLRGVLPPAEQLSITPELRLKASDQLNRMESLYITKVDQRIVGHITIQVVDFDAAEVIVQESIETKES